MFIVVVLNIINLILYKFCWCDTITMLTWASTKLMRNQNEQKCMVSGSSSFNTSTQSFSRKSFFLENRNDLVMLSLSLYFILCDSLEVISFQQTNGWLSIVTITTKSNKTNKNSTVNPIVIFFQIKNLYFRLPRSLSLFLSV